MVGFSRQGVDMRIVPEAEVAAFEAQGWEVYSAMTKNNWRPGQLIGPNGSDPAVIAKSMSFAPPDHHNDMSERRSATSTGHILQYRRPPGVCLGWGGYDEHTYWQSFGRRVTKDMTEKHNWPDDPLAPVTFVNESGEFSAVITPPLKREDLPSQPQKPVTLHDRLDNSGQRRKSKTAAEHKPATLAWPTDNDNE
ncbi:hypothetical protein LX36DRAFT_581332 [Colletotrichum falcatum]|nr:hypothetical protein LX36DRAFT_581332 [Colletotrichum falcatum]